MQASTESLLDLSATEAVAAMRAGDVSAETYAGALLARAAARADLNAFRTLPADAVLAAARAADLRRAAGEPLGALHGLPIPVKDSVDTADMPTSNGTFALRDFRPKADAEIVRRLEAQGALVMGKTNLHELSFGWTSANESFGAVRNPHDPDRSPGGSSGGSAAAVAAHMAPLAVAEDTWASIRLPAASCGLAGLRPSYGRYPDAGIMPLTTMFDTAGPLARTVADLALFDAVVTGEPAASPRDMRGARIGVARPFFWDDVDPEIFGLAEATLRRPREAGAIIVEVPVPDIVRETPAMAATIISYEARDCIAAHLARAGTGLTFDAMFETVGATVKGLMRDMALPPHRPDRAAYDDALRQRRRLIAEMASYFADNALDALLGPATMCAPPPIGVEDEITIAGLMVPLGDALARNMALASCAGLPGLVLPAGLTGQGLPVGLEMIGPVGRDRALLGLGMAMEAGGVVGKVDGIP